MAYMRYTVGLRRLLPAIGFHHVLMMIIALAWVVAALLLAGCTSSADAMSGVYLFSVSYGNSSQGSGSSNSLFMKAAKGGDLVVRAGYFGLCAKHSADGTWICGGGASRLRSIFAQRGLDPLDAIGAAAHFRDDVVFPGLLIAGTTLTILAFLGLATFPGWHHEDNDFGSEVDVRPFPSRPVSQFCGFALLLASLFLLAAALWQHVAAAAAASMLEFSSQDSLRGGVGATAVALVWIPFALVTIAFAGIAIMIKANNELELLTRD